jgi:hypothetical protein
MLCIATVATYDSQSLICIHATTDRMPLIYDQLKWKFVLIKSPLNKLKLKEVFAQVFSKTLVYFSTAITTKKSFHKNCC